MTSYSLLKDKMNDVLASLTERERRIVEMRGLVDGYERTLEEIGKQYKVTRNAFARSRRRRCESCATRPACAIFRASSIPRSRQRNSFCTKKPGKIPGFFLSLLHLSTP